MMKVSEFIEKFNSKTPNYTWMSKSELEDYVIKTCAWIGRHYACDEDRGRVINELNSIQIRIKEDTDIVVKFFNVEPVDGVKSIKGGWQRILRYKLVISSEYVSSGNQNYICSINFSFYDNRVDGSKGHLMYIKTGLLEDTVYDVDEFGNVKEYCKNHLI